MVRCAAKIWMVRATVGFALLLGEVNLSGNAKARQPRIRVRGVAADLGITFRVHDYAHLPVPTLSGVEARAAALFLEIGIRTQWETPVDHEPHSCTDRGANPQIPVIDVNILPAHMASRLNLPSGTLGYSILPPLGEPAYLADVFYSRALQMAQQGPADLDQLLGYAIAHEVGHLLLHSTTHSHSGIMRANWGPEEWKGISQGYLRFGADESARMRAEVAARIDASDGREEVSCADAAVVASADSEMRAFFSDRLASH